MTNREHQTLTSSILLYAAGKGLVYGVLTHDCYVVMMRRLFLVLQNSVSSLPDWLSLCSTKQLVWCKNSCVVSFSQCWPYITGLLSIKTMCVCCCCCMLIVAISSQVVFQVDWVSISAQDYSELLGAR